MNNPDVPHRIRRGLTAVVTLATLGVGLTGAAAFAGPNNTSGASSISVATANPAFGQLVGFNVVDPPTKSSQEISVSCSQNGQNVYLGVNTYSTPASAQFTLWSQQWADAGGTAANCVAQLFYYTWKGHTETGLVVEASTSFVAS
jgi:hypothetical protein